MVRKPAKLKELEVGNCVGKKKDGSFRYELSECPMSIMDRYQPEIQTVIDWQILDRYPFEYKETPLPFWSVVTALKSEADWYSNQTELET